MKKTAVAISFLVFSGAVLGCASVTGPKERDTFYEVRQVMNDIIDAEKAYISALKGASDSQMVVRAIDTFGNKMKGISVRAKELEKKYPHLLKGKKVPPEVKKEYDAISKLSKKMSDVQMTVLTNYRDDPAVKEAVKRLLKSMER